MAYKPLFGSKKREATWQSACFDAYMAGRGRLPICVHCDLPVTPGQDWDRSHIAVPKALGGKSVGVGHRKCNQLDNNEVVTPMVAKADRVRKKFVGITGPGLGRHPMQAGRRSRVRKTMRGGVEPRLTLAEKHKRFLAKRYFVEVEDFSEPLEVQP